jgi:hypothetical protein
MLRDYGSLGVGTPDGNIRFVEEITSWLTGIGEAAVARGYASGFEIKSKSLPPSSRSAGTIALYLVSKREPDFGATLVVSHREPSNAFRKGRADGVRVHAQARLLCEGRWQSENFKTGAIALMSTEDVAVLDVLGAILNRTTKAFGDAQEQ